MSVESKRLSLFEAYGVELEYMVVDRETLSVRPIADQLFTEIAGEPLQEIERGKVSLNNELAMHVVEMKTTRPEPILAQLPSLFQAEVRAINHLLEPANCMLMPSAMHPWMDSLTEMKLWPHGEKAVYDTLHRIFDCRGHGWANLQSTHLNLPFANDDEFTRLHSAIRMVLPLIPSLAASSPYADGKWTGYRDFRIHTYRQNQRKIFSITGHVIPEVVHSIEEYHQTILNRVYEDLQPHDPEGILRYEWVNSRGAIARFDRSAIEIRLIDIQEQPLMDCAILSIVAELLKLLVAETWGACKDYDALSCEELRAILDLTERQAENALIDHPTYTSLLGWKENKAPTARQLWQNLMEKPLQLEASLSEGAAHILEQGTLATRLHARLGNKPSRDVLATTYRDLCNCLEEGRPFSP